MGFFGQITLSAVFAPSLTACTDGNQAVGNAGSTASCDRECLIALTNSYLAALVAHDPAAVPLADDVEFVETGSRDRGAGLRRSLQFTDRMGIGSLS